MAKFVGELQTTYTQCHELLDVKESLFIQEAWDWRQPYLEFLLHKIALMLWSQKYLQDSSLKMSIIWRRCNQAPLRCLKMMKWQKFFNRFIYGYVVSTKGPLGSLNKWFIWTIVGPPRSLILVPLHEDVMYASVITIEFTLLWLKYTVCQQLGYFGHEPLIWFVISILSRDHIWILFLSEY